MSFGKDKLTELRRYDERAKKILSSPDSVELNDSSFGSKALTADIRAPYIYFENQLKNLLHGELQVLEIGSGTGLHTGSILEFGAKVTATDISSNSLNILKQRYIAHSDHLNTKVTDMENLPFDDASFDIVISAGSLSYGDNNIVASGIFRVLKPGGFFICVDSLNHNPLYRINRWFHYVLGKRTLSTLNRMPTLGMIELYRRLFKGDVKVRYFGAITWSMPVVRFLLGDDRAALFSEKIDDWVNVYRSAFKFVMVARKDGE